MRQTFSCRTGDGCWFCWWQRLLLITVLFWKEWSVYALIVATIIGLGVLAKIYRKAENQKQRKELGLIVTLTFFSMLFWAFAQQGVARLAFISTPTPSPADDAHNGDVVHPGITSPPFAIGQPLIPRFLASRFNGPPPFHLTDNNALAALSSLPSGRVRNINKGNIQIGRFRQPFAEGANAAPLGGVVAGGIKMLALLAGRVNSLFRHFAGDKGVHAKARRGVDNALAAAGTQATRLMVLGPVSPTTAALPQSNTRPVRSETGIDSSQAPSGSISPNPQQMRQLRY